jgi:hypothetical protein
MGVLNEVIGKVTTASRVTRHRWGRDAGAQALSQHARLHPVGSERRPEEHERSLPPPEQWVLSKMSDMEVAEMIEAHRLLYRGRGW